MAARWEKRPTSSGFTITVFATLALCIGANLTIFAVVDTILLRPLPFPDSVRLATVYNSYPIAGVMNDGSSLTNYYERRGHIPAFSSLSVYREASAIVGETGATEREPITRVTPEFFATLGIGMKLGRPFSEEETTFQTDAVVVVTHDYWISRLQGDPAALEREIRVDGTQMRIVGVLPPDFRFLSSEARLYLPLSSSPRQRVPDQRHAGGGALKMIARLEPGASLKTAQAQIDAHNAAVSLHDPEAKAMAAAGFRSPVVSLHEDHVASTRPMLLSIQAGALSLLVIGVVNLANLLLIRSSGRTKEFAVRQALGASHWHVVITVLAETTLIATVGGLLGLAVGAGGIQLLTVLGADKLPLGAQISLDVRLTLVALIGSIALSVILATPIAWFNLRTHLAHAMQSESRGGTAGRAARRLQHGFIVAQVALAFILLSGAALLGLSLRRAIAITPGFRASDVLTGQISLPLKSYEGKQARIALTGRLLSGIAGLPGVAAAGVSTNIPFSGDGGKSSVTVSGHILRPDASPRPSYTVGVDGDYFTAMGFTLVKGRFLTGADSRRPEKACVVDEDFARHYWPQGDAIGRRLYQGYLRPGTKPSEADAFTVVGVVAATKQSDLTDEEHLGAVYLPFGYRSSESLFVVLRANAGTQFLGTSLQGIVRQLDPDLPVNSLWSMETRIADSLVARRSPALLAVIFASVALLLTCIGTYSVLSYAVAQRRREIGVRLALGAQPQEIGHQFLRLGLRLVSVGTALGIVGSALAGRMLQTLLFSVPPLHLPTLVATTLLLGLISLGACLIPARRAARVDPMIVLRQG